MPPVDIATPSKMVASCQGCPPCASATKPAFCTLAAASMNSSQLAGALVTPALSSTALLAQTQLVECTLTGAAIHLPSYFEKACSAFGTVLSQPSLAATAFRSA